MKAKVISVLLIFLLGVSITGCSGGKNASDLNSGISSNTTISGNSSTSSSAGSSSTSDNTSDSSSTDSSKNSDASVPQSPSSASSDGKSENTNTQISSKNSNLVLEAYKAVMQNKAEFFSTDNKKKLYLDDFLTNKKIYETTFKVTHFTVLDMDGDKAPEVVLELSVGNEPQFYEILHYMNEAVYGYFIVYRGLEGLKADGTFGFSSGAADSGWGKLRFEANAFKIDKLAYSESSQGTDDLTISYFIKDKPVEKESFDSYAAEQSGKKDPAWYEFSATNIETGLSANP